MKQEMFVNANNELVVRKLIDAQEYFVPFSLEDAEEIAAVLRLLIQTMQAKALNERTN